MEFEVLGLDEQCTLKQAKKKLNELRLRYHPDKLVNMNNEEREKATRLLSLSESAFKRISDKKKVEQSMSVFSESFPQIHSFNFNNLFSDMENENKSRTTFSSSYTYSNINGVVKENGKINGKEMTDEELKQYRKKNKTPLLLKI